MYRHAGITGHLWGHPATGSVGGLSPARVLLDVSFRRRGRLGCQPGLETGVFCHRPVHRWGRVPSSPAADQWSLGEGWECHFSSPHRLASVCKAKMQYLLTLQVSRYCLSALKSSPCKVKIQYLLTILPFVFEKHPCKVKRQYLLILQVSRYCLLSLKSIRAKSKGSICLFCK